MDVWSTYQYSVVNPACAGMIRPPDPDERRQPSKPRVCGDDPGPFCLVAPCGT